MVRLESLDLDTDAFRFGDGVKFLYTHANSHDAEIGQAYFCDLFGQCFDQVRVTFRQYFLYARYHRLVIDDVADLVARGLARVLGSQFEIDANPLRPRLLVPVHADAGRQHQVADDDPPGFAASPFPVHVRPVRRRVSARPFPRATVGDGIVIPRDPYRPGAGAI